MQRGPDYVAMSNSGSTPRAVLFDLDGTLIDTAPDMAEALNRLLRERGREQLPFEWVRNQVSKGSVALVQLGFGTQLDDHELQQLRQRFLEIYADILCVNSRLFPGVNGVLAHIRDHDLQWGVVTNKPESLAKPLLDTVGLCHPYDCLVCGDTTLQRKPHPQPLLHACRLIATQPHDAVYVGDDPRDIEAGNAAGMTTLVALYGYIEGDQAPMLWGADGNLQQAADLIKWLNHSHNKDIKV